MSSQSDIETEETVSMPYEISSIDTFLWRKSCWSDRSGIKKRTNRYMCVFVQVCACDSTDHGSFYRQCAVFTIWRSSMRAFTPASISFLSWGVSGHGYKVALNLKGTDEESQMRMCWLRALWWFLPRCCYSKLADLPLADLFDSVLQLISLEEDDEDRLVHLVALWEFHTVRMTVMYAWLGSKQTLCVSTAQTVVGSSSGSSMSACFRNTFPLQTLHSIRSNVGIRSLPMTPATNLSTTIILNIIFKNCNMANFNKSSC